ncbi:hypothetical protein DFH09DRAFT_1320921 [Mycena vulgaris]|nr:hypothetical protein DFH09DRAFT_1320921 [Mycena vulgaris]
MIYWYCSARDGAAALCSGRACATTPRIERRISRNFTLAITTRRTPAPSTSRARSDLRRQPPPVYVYFIIGIQCIARRRDEINGHRARPMCTSAPSRLGLPYSHRSNTPACPTYAHFARSASTPHTPRELASAQTKEGTNKSGANVELGSDTCPTPRGGARSPAYRRRASADGRYPQAGRAQVHPCSHRSNTPAPLPRIPHACILHDADRGRRHPHEMSTPPNENETTRAEHGTEANRTSGKTEDAGVHPDSLQLPAADYRAERPRRTQSRAHAHARSHPATHHPLRQPQHAGSAESALMEVEDTKPGAVSPPSLGAASIDGDAVPYAQSIDRASSGRRAASAEHAAAQSAVHLLTPTAAPTLASAPASAAACPPHPNISHRPLATTCSPPPPPHPNNPLHRHPPLPHPLPHLLRRPFRVQLLIAAPSRRDAARAGGFVGVGGEEGRGRQAGEAFVGTMPVTEEPEGRGPGGRESTRVTAGTITTTPARFTTPTPTTTSASEEKDKERKHTFPYKALYRHLLHSHQRKAISARRSEGEIDHRTKQKNDTGRLGQASEPEPLPRRKAASSSQGAAQPIRSTPRRQRRTQIVRRCGVPSPLCTPPPSPFPSPFPPLLSAQGRLEDIRGRIWTRILFKVQVQDGLAKQVAQIPSTAQQTAQRAGGELHTHTAWRA